MLGLLLRTPAAAAVEAIVFAPGQTLHVPHLLDIEVAQVVRRYTAQRQIEPSRGRAALDDLAQLPLQRHAHTVLLPRIWQLRANLTAYDATYLALAEALDAVLVTCDRRLAAAAGPGAAIELV